MDRPHGQRSPALATGAPPPTPATPARPQSPLQRRLRFLTLTLGARLLARLLGAADGRAVGTMAARELWLILRSWSWHHFLMMWCLFCAGLILAPLLYRSDLGRWLRPTGREWFVICGYTLQAAAGMFMVQWTVRRLRRDLYTSRMDELLLTRCSAADIAMGEALASAVASLWLVLAAFPACLFISALAGLGPGAAARLTLSLVPVAALGVWFGMGWGLAFALRRPGAAFGPLTDWWVKAPLVPVYVVWGALLGLPILWAVLALIPNGMLLVNRAIALLQWSVTHVTRHWNPALTVPGAGGLWGTTWLTDWLVLCVFMLFLMRKSMDSVNAVLSVMQDRDDRRRETDHWVHHDGHYFTQYRDGKRREPAYYDGGNPIAAFDVALGHRIYVHPFLWSVAIMAYFCLLAWALCFPTIGGVFVGSFAVLLPATTALVLMSGGVAVSFGWERDQHRWPALAVLPIENHRLGLGKIKGVVRPNLWIALVASLTAALLGVRGTLDWDVALWMALHVLVFPVALAFVSACLALTTPTVGEALYRWSILGAIPAALTALPPPLGGESGLAVPFNPPLLVLMLVLNGPSPALIRGAWIALGLEVAGILIALLILGVFLRRLTVGERD
jgi:hypothetical protein